MAKRTTLRDIAEAVGVHHTTVSLVLRNHPRIPKLTREKVLKAAKELGYRPDPLLKALNAYRTTQRPPHYQATIGWIDNWPRRNQLRTKVPLLESLIGAETRARELGFALEEIWLNEPGLTREKLHRVLTTKNIDILLFPPQQFSGLPRIDFEKFFSIAIGYSIQPAIIHVVSSNHFHFMKLAMQNLWDLGYRRIGLILPAFVDARMENACHDSICLAQHLWPGLSFVPSFRDDNIREYPLATWLKTNEPDAVLSLYKVAREIEKLGYRIPQDIGFAGIDLPQDEKILSGIHQNNELLGRVAVDLAVGMYHRNERGVPEFSMATLVDGVWRPGKTLRRRKPG